MDRQRGRDMSCRTFCFGKTEKRGAPNVPRPISQYKILLLTSPYPRHSFEKQSSAALCHFVRPRTGRLPPRRLAIWFLKIAYAPLAAAAGARASWAGRAKGRKGGSSSPLSMFSSRRLKYAPSLPDGRLLRSFFASSMRRTRLRPGGFSRSPFGRHFSSRSGQGRSESA